MKTAREILLNRHRAAEATLDRLRQDVVSELPLKEPTAAVAAAKGQEVLMVRALLKLWRELIFPSRYAWGGLAAVWIGLLAVNLQMKSSPPLAVSTRFTPAVEALQALKEQRRVLAELLPPPDLPTATKPRSSPRPRTEQVSWRYS